MESNPLPPDVGPPIPVTEPSKEEKTMAMLCHLLAFSGLIFWHVPIMNIVGPLLLWLIKRDSMPFVNEQGKEALNFNITVSIIGAACVVTIWLILPIAILIGLAVAWVVLTIIAAIQASEGKHYRYPYILRLVK